jgi:hypothetical protein
MLSLFKGSKKTNMTRNNEKKTEQTHFAKNDVKVCVMPVTVFCIDVNVDLHI